MAVGTQEIQAIMDLTAEAEVSAADIKQIVDTAQLANDKGGVLHSEDTALDTPDVPDASDVTRWQRYWWKRQPHSTAADKTPIWYFWNPYAGLDATLLRWVTLVVTVDVPTELPPNGDAGGDLDGEYPNPVIGANKVTASKLSSSTTIDVNRSVTGDHIRDNTITFTKLKLGIATPEQIIKVMTDGTTFEAATKKVTEVAEPTTGDAFKILRVVTAETGYEKVAAGIIQSLYKKISSQTLSGTFTFDASIPQISEGVLLTSIDIAPKLATSILRFRCWCGIEGDGTSSGKVGMALFKAGSVDSLCATWIDSNVNTMMGIMLEFYVVSGSTASVTYSIRVGSDGGDVQINREAATAVFGAAANSFFTVEEIFATEQV